MLNYSKSGTIPNLLKLVICIVSVISCQIIDSVKSENIGLSDSLITGPVSLNGFNIILGTSDLAVGTNRFTFAIVSKDGLLDLPMVQVKTIFKGQVKQATKAEFELLVADTIDVENLCEMCTSFNRTRTIVG